MNHSPVETTTPYTTLVHFELPYLPANEVFLAGTFNDWHPARFPLTESDDGSWQKNLQLAPGTYEYRFVVAGRWLSDPNNPRRIANPFGSLNSVTEVSPPPPGKQPRYYPLLPKTNLQMKTVKTPIRSRNTSARLVLTDKTGRRAATAPAIELAPIRFRIRKILVPVDFSEPSQKALHYARPFAEQFGASLTLIPVLEPLPYPLEFGYIPIEAPDLEQQRLTEIGSRLTQLGKGLRATVPVTSFIRVGCAWKEIVEAAKSEATDLILVATHGYTGLQ